jgi:fructokinase
MTGLMGAIEAGGTKFVCAVGTGPGDLSPATRIPTTTPDETMALVLEYFRAQRRAKGALASLGVGAFGPLDLHPASPSYGSITATPKPGWSQVNLKRILETGLDLPVYIDTDVNAAALGEGRWGAARGLDTFLYLTVGTGIGGGAVVNGQPIHGLVHPEMGHVLLPHDRERDPYPGACPFHGDCFEGLANGPAIADRWGTPAEQLPPDHPAWELEAHYISLALMILICAHSPQRIILGGGVMQQGQLFPMIRRQVPALLNGYVQAYAILNEMDSYVVPPALGGQAGLLGALALAASMATTQ